MSEIETQSKLNEILALIEGLNSQAYLQRIRTKVDDTLAIVPTLSMGAADNFGRLTIPADRYYAMLGLNSVGVPDFMGNLLDGTSTWDLTETRRYRQFNTAAAGYSGQPGAEIIYPNGVGGTATAFQPKNSTATYVKMGFRAKFDTAADYDDQGIGCADVAGLFSSRTYSIQVSRTAGAWQLRTKDGTTRSSSTGGTADGAWHDFLVTWQLLGGSPNVTLYVDGTSTIVKATNVPNIPMVVNTRASAANTLGIQDYLVEWAT